MLRQHASLVPTSKRSAVESLKLLSNLLSLRYSGTLRRICPVWFVSYWFRFPSRRYSAIENNDALQQYVFVVNYSTFVCGNCHLRRSSRAFSRPRLSVRTPFQLCKFNRLKSIVNEIEIEYPNQIHSAFK
jgi:hypothetical protein